MTRNMMLALLLPLTAGVCLGQTVTLSLDSPQDGTAVAPGTTIIWSIAFEVSAGDNEGLALLITDLVQDPANPELLTLPTADVVPTGMTNFARPAGITNPGDLVPEDGYLGLQRGPAGAENLLQIGGCQNTFGIAQPSGTGIAEDNTVMAGVGQSGPAILATGAFAAPSTDGTYQLSLENALANVLTTVNSPPMFSPVVGATVDTTAGAVSFTVAAPACPNDPTGALCDTDVTGDCLVNNQDLGVLLASYLQAAGDASYNPDVDFDANDVVNNVDLGELLADYLNNCQ